MNSFTIKDLESLTGIKAHTIRIWEQRYNVMRPKRKDTNHRIYDNGDLKHIMRIAYLYRHGYKISKIANMTDEEIKQLSLEEGGQKGTHLHQVYINQLVEAMIDFDQTKFEKIFHNVLLRMGFEQTILKVIYPYMERIGLLWLVDCVIPAQEHFAANIIRKKLMVAIDGLDLPKEGDEKFLLFLPEGEFHEVPLLFTQYMLKKHGCAVVNFGANVPLEDLSFYTDRKQVDHIYTHIITNFPQRALDNFVRDLGRLFPGIPVTISGPQIVRITPPLPDNVTLLMSMEEVLQYVRRKVTL
ncbi:MerR family transcriptional regulator [Chitinophaga sp. SYP-B3965]|uniref:MerR family transcriptional regulator n=1 Tax=Chitinophaga sp. SYP-B3965 TaxID=2663120 RepID=UPI001299B1BC|nr:MerR family transcriptional regulator [Chitinophaga sp. SYP-B3965]MRG48534.1 MerR family transcriptional regulator [Chitinophaga sp. SYP-B3965]